MREREKTKGEEEKNRRTELVKGEKRRRNEKEVRRERRLEHEVDGEE